MSREKGNVESGRDRDRRSEAARAAAARPSARSLSRAARERRNQQILLFGVGAIGVIAALVVAFGAYRETVGFPGEPVALVAGQRVSLRSFTDDLSEEMRNLQSQVAASSQNQQNPSAASSQVQRLIESQERLPEEILEKNIQKSLIAQEATARGIIISRTDVDAKVNEFLSIQRDLFSQPTPTATVTSTPRATATETPEGFVPPTATPTRDPLTPTATLNPLTQTATRTPFPTRETPTPNVTATIPPTMVPDDYGKAYEQLKKGLRSEDRYRQGLEDQLMRDRLRESFAATVPRSGPAAQVLRISTSTRDEALVARLQLTQFDYPFEEVVAQAGGRVVEGENSGDLGWVALGAQSREFDTVVFSSETPLNVWSEPFAAGNHFELVFVKGRQDNMTYERDNITKMGDRAFKEWLSEREASAEIVRDLSAQERQWAVDRASKGIIETTTQRGT